MFRIQIANPDQRDYALCVGTLGVGRGIPNIVPRIPEPAPQNPVFLHKINRTFATHEKHQELLYNCPY